MRNAIVVRFQLSAQLAKSIANNNCCRSLCVFYANAKDKERDRQRESEWERERERERDI